MSEKNYVIDDYYEFDAVADGARPSIWGTSRIHLQFEHDEVMEMGEYFLNCEPYEVEDSFLKEQLDEILARNMASQLEEEWNDEHDGDEEEDESEKPDFIEEAYGYMCEMYHCWDSRLQSECIDYYLAHKKA